MRTLMIAFVAALALAAPAWAADREPPIQGIFAIAGKAVPLPAGDWQVVARRATPATETSANIPLRSAVLVQRSGDRVIAAITVHANDSPLRRNPPPPADCKRGDVHLAIMLYET